MGCKLNSFWLPSLNLWPVWDAVFFQIIWIPLALKALIMGTGRSSTSTPFPFPFPPGVASLASPVRDSLSSETPAWGIHLPQVSSWYFLQTPVLFPLCIFTLWSRGQGFNFGNISHTQQNASTSEPDMRYFLLPPVPCPFFQCQLPYYTWCMTNLFPCNKPPPNLVSYNHSHFIGSWFRGQHLGLGSFAGIRWNYFAAAGVWNLNWGRMLEDGLAHRWSRLSAGWAQGTQQEQLFSTGLSSSRRTGRLDWTSSISSLGAVFQGSKSKSI